MIIAGIFSILGSFGWLGNFGYSYANLHFMLFGYLGYIWLFCLAYLCSKINYPLKLDEQFLEKSLGVVLIIIALLTLQSLFLADSGMFGIALNSILQPLIKATGVFLLSCVILFFGILLFTQKSLQEFYAFFIKDIKKDWYALSKNLHFKNFNFYKKYQNLFSFLKKSFNKAQSSSPSPRPLTLEELMSRSSQNQENLNEKEDKTQNTLYDLQIAQDIQENIEEDSLPPLNTTESIDKNREESELLIYEKDEQNPKDLSLQEEKDIASKIKLIPIKDIQQKNLQNFVHIDPKEAMEKLKKIEKTLYKEPQSQENTLKLIPKSEIQAPQTLEQPPEIPKETPKEPKKIKPIKTYPKDLYAPKPFSAYLENNDTPTKEIIPAINEESTLPNTIFYYSKKDNQTPKETPQKEHLQTAENPQNLTLSPPISQTEESKENRTKNHLSTTNQIGTKSKTLQPIPQNQTYENPKDYSTNFFSNNEIPLYGFTNIPSPPPSYQNSTTQDSLSYSINTQLQPKQDKVQPTPTTQQSKNITQETPKEALRETLPLKAPQVKTLKENEALLHQMDYNTSQEIKEQDFILPKLEFLQQPQEERIEIDESEIDRKINDLLSKLRMFKIEGDIVCTYSGPIVTTFEFRPSPNVKVSRILTLQDDLAMALRAKTIRIQAPVPGKDVVGIEIPNNQIQTIYLREILENDLFQSSTSPLTLALGKDIVGNPFITDLKKLPHLLIAGTTGSGKSVGINAMILSLLYKNTPDELKLIMIDPKMLEFSIYNDIPHLLTPVITQPKKAIIALDNTVKEMERRYSLMSEVRTKNIEGYNQKAQIEGFDPFPYIVVIIDELADLMMSGGKEAEISISRLAQMARASGIHLIVATQRPSVDVVTGIIKANLPSRISYKVGQKIDSKVILDTFGAESLLGRGDMLFTPPSGGIVRLHAPWSTEYEIEEIVNFIKSQRAANYDENFMPSEDESLGLRYEGETDELYEEAKRIILNDRKTSISYIQRRLGIGYNKAANIIEQMQTRGFLSEPNAKGVREILEE